MPRSLNGQIRYAVLFETYDTGDAVSVMAIYPQTETCLMSDIPYENSKKDEISVYKPLPLCYDWI